MTRTLSSEMNLSAVWSPMEIWPSLQEWGKIILGESTWAERFLRPAIVYLALLAAFRISGKREMGQLSPFDFLIVVLIADAVQNGMVGQDTSLLGNLVPAMVLIALSVLFDRITLRSKKAAAAIEGEPTLLVYNGVILEQNCSGESVSKEELLSELRRKGLASVREVRFAVLEAEGSVSIIKNDAPQPNPEDDTVTETIYKQARQAGLA